MIQYNLYCHPRPHVYVSYFPTRTHTSVPVALTGEQLLQQALQQQSASNIPDAPSIGGIAAPHTATPHQHSSYGNRIRSSTLGRAAKRERYTNLHIRAGTTLTIESEHTSAIIYGSFTIATTQAFLQVLLLPTLTTPFTPGLLYEYMGHSVRKTFIYERVRASGLSPPHSSTPELNSSWVKWVSMQVWCAAPRL